MWLKVKVHVLESIEYPVGQNEWQALLSKKPVVQLRQFAGPAAVQFPHDASQSLHSEVAESEY
jgi:hypothetical protein